MIIQNLWDTTKAALKGKLIAIKSCLRRQEKISNKQPIFIPEATRLKKQTKPNVSISKKNQILGQI